MITYDTLKELAHALSKVTGCRYVAFEYLYDFVSVHVGNRMYYWHPDGLPPFYQYHWIGGDVFNFAFPSKCNPNRDWSKCQFDCEEEENEEES